MVLGMVGVLPDECYRARERPRGQGLYKAVLFMLNLGICTKKKQTKNKNKKEVIKTKGVGGK